MNAEQLRAVLNAYREVVTATWPHLHADIAQKSRQWSTASDAQLKAELEGYIAQVARVAAGIRIFWKIGPEYEFAGANERFAADAGLTPAELIGATDFDTRLPWRHQAAKYRADDRKIVQSGQPDLDILERQQSSDGETVWVKAGKAPLRTEGGEVIGLLGMYEVLDAETARKLFTQRFKKPS